MRTMRVAGTLGAILAVSVAGVLFGQLADDRAKVFFSAVVGDGKVWAGDFDVTYTIGTTPRTVHVTALPQNNVNPVSWAVQKLVAHGTAVSMAASAQWPGKPIKLQIRAVGVNPQPVFGVSPATVTIVRTVP